jgi:hypothetical protein
MRQLENDLQDALRRRPAPPGFAARLLARIERDASFRTAQPRRPPTRRLWMLAAAAVLMAAVGAGVFEHARRIRVRNEAALQRTLTALSIAATQLDRVERKALSTARWEQLREQLTGLRAIDAERQSHLEVHSNGA